MLKIPPYKIEVIVVATPSHIAWDSVKSRYNEMKKNGLEPPRAVPWEFFEKSGEAIPETVQYLWENCKVLSVSNIAVLNRTMLNIYNSEWMENIDPKLLVERQLNKDECEMELVLC